MAVINRFPQGGSGDISKIIPNFPKGYVMKSTALGDVFPGWSADIYPVCVDVSVASKSIAVQGSWSRNNLTSSYNINNIRVLNAYASIANPPEATLSLNSVYAKCIFLPELFNWDWNAIKTNVTSGTCTVWLEPK